MDGINRSSRATNPMKGGGINHPPRCRLVEPDATRVACPCSMEASSSNPTRRGWRCRPDAARASNPAILSHTRVETGRQGTTRRRDQLRRAVSNEAGANPATGVRATAAFPAANRVQVPSGPFNRAGVGSPRPGNRRGRALTAPGDPRQIRGPRTAQP